MLKPVQLTLTKQSRFASTSRLNGDSKPSELKRASVSSTSWRNPCPLFTQPAAEKRWVDGVVAPRPVETKTLIGAVVSSELAGSA